MSYSRNENESNPAMTQMVVFHGVALPQGLGITEEKVAVFPTLPARKDDIFTLGGLWFDHVLSWWKHRDDPNILFLTYEDRIKDPADAVLKLAKFIGKEISPETRDLIVQQTSFSTSL